MDRRTRVLTCLLIALLAGCSMEDDHVRSEEARPEDLVDPKASAEELYYEVLRLHSVGWLSQERLHLLQDVMGSVDDLPGSSDQERERLLRDLLASTLRRTWNELRQGEDAAVAEAEQGRGYARRMYRAGLQEAERGAEGVIFIADMLGFPTSKESAVLMVAAPFGGYLVVKAGKMGLKRAAFLLRRFQKLDDFVERQAPRGLEMLYAANRSELESLVGREAVAAAERAEAHVGALAGRGVGKANAWNPLNGKDNCSACVAAVIKNSLEESFLYTAEDIQRRFGSAGRAMKFDVDKSLRYIERATGLKATSRPVAMLDPKSPVGHYAVFTRWDGGYKHVVYGRVTATRRVVIYDPQAMERMTYQELLKRYGKAATYLLEAP
ncbi:hypothetical protein ACN28S_23665 [Cystobacter fuscus]